MGANMAESGESYKIKTATGTESLIVMVLAVIVVADLVRRAYVTDEGLLFYAAVLVLIYCVVLTVLALIRVFKKPGELLITRKALSLYGRTLEASQIDEIMVNGFSRKLIGIKPKGRRLVPLALGFRFVEDANEAFKDLEHWAAANQVQMTEKKFFKWI
ncbi:hypothetical protein GCM10010917_35000 [Paenibacillus physcomitrellae]|uniref:PH domain-containing protein n=2 Tax=Paenibacillus physcomitrellae TaxID=1619311 RepID=A0ABQ1GMB3_9BACL|nr:hypothetical protein GCM10010917_35000 [Paenibacillus physcomitrellae]